MPPITPATKVDYDLATLALSANKWRLVPAGNQWEVHTFKGRIAGPSDDWVAEVLALEAARTVAAEVTRSKQGLFIIHYFLTAAHPDIQVPYYPRTTALTPEPTFAIYRLAANGTSTKVTADHATLDAAYLELINSLGLTVAGILPGRLLNGR